MRCLILAVCLIVVAGFSQHATASPPNIILVMTDDQGYPPLARNGHPWIRTPHLDSFFDNSTRFERFLVSPTCSPTRSALMTGRHSMRNGVTHTILERERLTLNAETLPQVLSAVGYQTGIFGKWHLGDEDAYQPHNRGFKEAFIHGAGGIGQAYDCSCADVPNNSYFDPVVRHNGVFRKTRGFCTDVFFAAARDWIGRMASQEQLFFAYITTNAPHGPFLAPEPWKKRFLQAGFSQQQAGFYGMIENIDDNFGQLIALLQERQLLRDTVVIFMSDNGMTGNGAGRPGRPLGKAEDGSELALWNAEMKGFKGSPHEGGLRVPFLVRWDGHWQPGRTITRIAGDIDVFPTIVDLAGGKNPAGQVEGRSLVPLLDDTDSEWQDRYLYTHVGRWKTGEEPNDYQWKNFSVRNQRFRFVNNTELYDMDRDPGQTTNVIEEHPAIVDAMRKAYDQWWKKTRPMMVNETAPMSPVRPFHVHYNEQLKTTGIPDWKPSGGVED